MAVAIPLRTVAAKQLVLDAAAGGTVGSLAARDGDDVAAMAGTVELTAALAARDGNDTPSLSAGTALGGDLAARDGDDRSAAAAGAAVGAALAALDGLDGGASAAAAGPIVAALLVLDESDRAALTATSSAGSPLPPGRRSALVVPHRHTAVVAPHRRTVRIG